MAKTRGKNKNNDTLVANAAFEQIAGDEDAEEPENKKNEEGIMEIIGGSSFAGAGDHGADSTEEEDNNKRKSSSQDWPRGTVFGAGEEEECENLASTNSTSNRSFQPRPPIQNHSNQKTQSLKTAVMESNNITNRNRYCRSASMGSTTSATSADSNSRRARGGGSNHVTPKSTNEITSKIQNQVAINITKLVEKISFSFDKVVR